MGLTYFFPVAGTPDVKLFQKAWFEEVEDVENFEQELLGISHDGYDEPQSLSSSYQKKMG